MSYEDSAGTAEFASTPTGSDVYTSATPHESVTMSSSLADSLEMISSLTEKDSTFVASAPIFRSESDPGVRRNLRSRRIIVPESEPSINVKHIENDYDFMEEASNESWLTLPIDTLQKNNLFTEKSQHTTKNEGENEEGEGLEPFARECLHLFNGEWTVLNPNRGQAFQIAPPTDDYKHLFKKTNDDFEVITKRSTNHPQSFFEK
jgi:hypothetical protein